MTQSEIVFPMLSTHVIFASAAGLIALNLVVICHRHLQLPDEDRVRRIVWRDEEPLELANDVTG